jgi:serine/threonine protein phosphatase PrpC
MEDTHAIQLALGPSHPNTTLVAVFDGHGGDEASKYLAEHLPLALAELKDPHDPVQLRDCFVKHDLEFYKTHPTKTTAGATIALVLIEPFETTSFRVTSVHVGDSRVLLLRKQVLFATTDHKPNIPEEKKRICDAGGFVSYNNRVNGNLAVSRAFGDWDLKFGDKTPELQPVTCIPTVTTMTAEKGDTILVCCDGIFEKSNNEAVNIFLYECMQPHYLVSMFQFLLAHCCNHCRRKQRNDEAGHDPAALAAQLCDFSLQCGSKDNMTAAIVCLGYVSIFFLVSRFITLALCLIADKMEVLPIILLQRSHDNTLRDVYPSHQKKNKLRENVWVRLFIWIL